MQTEGDMQMMSMQWSNITFYILETQEGVNFLTIQGGCWIFRIQGRIWQGVGKNSGGVETPSELCFGASEIEYSASWSYIMYAFLTLLLKLLDGFIQWSNIICIYNKKWLENHQKNDDFLNFKIWPKEVPLGFRNPLPLKQFEGGLAPPEQKMCADTWPPEL